MTSFWKDGLAYTRGSSDDYDRYAKLTGDPGWSWNNILPYLRKVLRFMMTGNILLTVKLYPE